MGHVLASGLSLGAAVLCLACSSFFGEHADADCYPSCRPAEAFGVLFSRPFPERPQEVDVTACPGGACSGPVRVMVGDESDGDAAPMVQSGRFSYMAYVGGDWPVGDVVVSVNCVACEPWSAGDYLDVTVETVDQTTSFRVRATAEAKIVNSSRIDESSFESSCSDASRRQCEELRPSYEDL